MKLAMPGLLAAIILAVGFLGPIGTPANAQEAPFTSDQERAIRKLVIQTILERPEIILEAVRALDAQTKNDKDELVQRTIVEQAGDIFNNPDDQVGGNPDGDVTLVEFFDYRCGYCKKVHPLIKQLLKEDGNIRYVYKEFPILGSQSVYAAKAALASRSQGKYAEFSNALMESRGTLDKDKVLSIAGNVGLDASSLETEIQREESAFEAILDNNYKLAQDLDITGTPGFVAGKLVIRGAVDLEALKTVVAHARVNGKKGEPQ